jgi:hypothetical protein
MAFARILRLKNDARLVRVFPSMLGMLGAICYRLLPIIPPIFGDAVSISLFESLPPRSGGDSFTFDAFLFPVRIACVGLCHELRAGLPSPSENSKIRVLTALHHRPRSTCRQVRPAATARLLSYFSRRRVRAWAASRPQHAGLRSLVCFLFTPGPGPVRHLELSLFSLPRYPNNPITIQCSYCTRAREYDAEGCSLSYRAAFCRIPSQTFATLAMV